MKRILSVILSLALLASALIIPMSVSAEGTLTAEEAYNQLNAAVDGLVLDFDAARQNGLLTETAYPVGSQTKGDDGEAYVNKTGNISISDTDNSLPSKIGSKYVNVTGNTANEGGWGLRPSDLHTLRYQYSSTVTDKSGLFCLKDIGYIVLYVKTNRDFNFGMFVHNNVVTPAIIDGYKVSQTEDNYEPIIINMTKIDWTTQWDFKSAYMGKSVNWGFFPAIESFTDGNQTITSADGIVFGSLFCVPVDTAVRDFKYDLTGTYPDYPTKKYETLSADMIHAAELIKNDDGRYTAESFAALQEAIKNAKATLINDGTNDVNDALALFKAEVANLYKLEEVFRPKFVDGSERAIANAGDVKNLSEYQRSLLGEHYIKIESSDLGKDINFVDVSATAQYPDSPVKDYTKYRDIYLYVVNNTGSVYYVPTFNAYIGGNRNSDISFYDKNLYVNSRHNSFKLNTTVTRCDIFDLTVVNRGNPYDKYDVRYFVNNYTFDNGDGTTTTYYDKYKGSSRIQWKIPTGDLSDTSNLILGSMMGEIAFDTTGDKDLELLESKEENIFRYYNKYIAGQGYINTDDIESTLSAMGAISIPVTGFYEKYATITYPNSEGYTLDVVPSGGEVSFKVDVKEDAPTGVTVKEVKYGGEVKTAGENGVYTIQAEAGKTLEINLSTVTTEFAVADVQKYFDPNDTTTNIARGKTPHVFLTNRTGESATRKLLSATNAPNLSDGKYPDSNADIGLGMYFCTNGTFLNGYVPYNGNADADFDFTKAATEYQAYVDIIYDLGATADINKVQQISNRIDGLQLGLYEVYASKDINDLFDRSKSLVVSYQNKTAKTGSTKTCNEQHEFPTRSARFVAFRVYSSTTYSTGNSNTLRTRELAIYGTITGDYTVSEKLNLPSSDTPLTPEEGSKNLLNGKQATVEYTDYAGKTTNKYEKSDIIAALTNSSNKIDSHKDFGCATYKSNGTLYNGYTIERNADVNIKFTRDTNTPIEHYTDFTFELNSYYKVTDFGFYNYDQNYESFNCGYKVQAFQVYIGKDKTNLYTENNLAITCENYFNNSVHEFKFNKTRVGKYIGVRVLMSNLSDNNIRIAEIAAYGTEVGAPDEGSKLAPEIITSKSGYIYNKDGSSVFDYKNSNGETVKGTALRLTVGYKSPKVPGGANASQIVLANGKTANVIERNVIAIAKSKYDSKQDFNIHTEGASVTTSTATSTKHPVSNYFKSEIIKDSEGNIIEEEKDYRMTYGALNINNISETNASKEVVVRGRVVYEYDGEIYAVYSDIVGDEDTEVVSAESAYKILCKNIAGANNGNYNSPLWFNDTKWNGTEFITQTSAQ